MAALAAGAVACSGADNILLEDSGTQPTDDGSVVQTDASPGEDVTTIADATTEDVEHPKDASVVDVVVDTWTGPPDSKIQCGPTTTCSAQKEMCCWHQSSTTKQFECVTSGSSCSGTYDVVMTCSGPDNCASQGNAGYQCCATGGNLGWNACYNYDVASSVTCKSQCATYDYELGCNIQQ
ncbi:MAG TPA: hypothetical protein VGH87_19205, partial [Polyangiaceae bacterium]